MEQKKIAILGSTGAIGTNTLDVISAHPDKFVVTLLTAHNNSALLIRQALAFAPHRVVIGNETQYEKVKDALSHTPTQVLMGAEAILEAIAETDIDFLVAAIVGVAGLLPVRHAIESGINIGLANKEPMVVAGKLISSLARQKGIEIIPIDSEHSAIFQCLVGENIESVKKITLTASGGPFRGKSRDFLQNIGKKEALKHPNWEMGQKITIDSATLMNKGLEMIEAQWLFGLSPKQIEVIVHPQSAIHSFVAFVDGSWKAQLGTSDMRHPIQYALSYPDRITAQYPPFQIRDMAKFDFTLPDMQTFGCLSLAFEAMKQGGTLPCVLNAANEVAVEAFLNEQIGFLDIERIVRKSMEHFSNHSGQSNTIEELLNLDKEVRLFVHYHFISGL